MTRTIAVVPAYNEAATVEAVLKELYPLVDYLIIVDDGSSDNTREIIQQWADKRANIELLVHEVNRGMSEAYQTAFAVLGRRVARHEFSKDDIVYTVDADLQHDLSVLEHLRETFDAEHLDALLARRDLSGYPRYKRLGNWVMSTWASMCAGQRLLDVESGYRVFRVGPLVDAQNYYKGYRYSETIEVAVVLCRLGYRVTNDLLVPVPVYRSNTRYKDVVIDLVMGPLAAWRVFTRRRRVERRLVMSQQSAT
jgi:glycosyltransferase involved in cell wall biosynthesis